MIAVAFDKVDAYVAKLQRKGINVRWEGWDMVFFKPDRRALRSINGRRNGDEWGFETKISPNKNGEWLINYHLAQRLVRGANV